MDIDVLMPCAGKGRFFEEAIRSALAQTSPPSAIYVVDNACDHTTYRDVVDEIDSPLVKYIRFENRLPPIENWQRCLGVGNSAYAAFLHDDDVWPPDYFTQASAIIAREQVAAVLTSKVHFVDSEPPREGESLELFRRLLACDQQVAHLFLLTSCAGHMSSLVFLRAGSAFRVATFVAADQLFVDQFVYRNSLALNAETAVQIREHSAALTVQARGGSWTLELIYRAQENLAYMAERYPWNAQLIEEFVRHKGGGAYAFLMHACYAKPALSALRDLRSRLMSGKHWRHVAGKVGTQGLVFRFLPAVFRGIFTQLVLHLHARR